MTPPGDLSAFYAAGGPVGLSPADVRAMTLAELMGLYVVQVILFKVELFQSMTKCVKIHTELYM